VMHPLRSAETVQIPDHLSPEEIKQFLGSAFFNQNARLILQIQTASELLTVIPASLTILGRSAESHPDGLFVDLTSYDARTKGVSRLHAALRRTDVSLAIEDWNSTNGTYLNGGRLPPRQAQTLHDGDELRLGMLHMRIAFQYG
jgi:pSer/pThr/pTyr-binding forkhead associated (FHA) protein